MIKCHDLIDDKRNCFRLVHYSFTVTWKLITVAAGMGRVVFIYFGWK